MNEFFQTSINKAICNIYIIDIKRNIPDGINMLFSSILKKKWLIILAVTFLALAFAVALAAFWVLNLQTIYDGVWFEGINLGGLDKMQADSVIENIFQEKYAKKHITFRHEDNSWTCDVQDINLKYPTSEIIKEAYKTGRTGNLFQRLYEIVRVRFKGKRIIAELEFDEELLKRKLAEIKLQIDEKGRNAEVKYENGKIDIKKDEPGKVLDINKNFKLFSEKVSSGDFYEISLIVDKFKPDITYDNVKVINHVVSSFTTYFNPSDVNRTHNVKISCEKINGIILMPGDIFSMNKALGPRTVENGYKEALIVYKNEYIDGIGGGVCQTTTTLYNSVLKAKLKVLERTHHSLPSLYVGLGQDATISGDYIDFKFQNDKDYPVCISAEVAKNQIVIRILGKKENDYTVKLVSKVVERYAPEKEEIEIDNSLAFGEKVVERKAREGFRVILYRETYDKNGKLKSREKISEDVYKPVNAMVKMNEKYYNYLYGSDKKSD